MLVPAPVSDHRRIEASQGIPSGELEALRPLAQRVLTELRAADKFHHDHMHKAVLLALTVCVFVAFEFVHNTWQSILMLALVLLLHESGHYLAMRLFHYQNRKIFFIPFYGGTIAADDGHAPGHHRVVVALLGPLPGILLGILIASQASSVGWQRAAEVLLVVNVFNLLPFVPLDGGHVWHQLLFCRTPRLEVGSLLFAAGFLFMLAWGRQDWILAILGGLMLFKAHTTWKTTQVCAAVRERGEVELLRDLAQVTPELLLPLLRDVRIAFPRVREAGPIAERMRDLLSMLHTKPPRRETAILLGGVYCACVALAAIGLRMIKGV